eukprot:11219201-Lingulodinium_polyedra.AAC.1
MIGSLVYLVSPKQPHCCFICASSYGKVGAFAHEQRAASIFSRVARVHVCALASKLKHNVLLMRLQCAASFSPRSGISA